MKRGLTKRYRKFGWEFFELLDWRREVKVRKKYKKSFSKRARALESVDKYIINKIWKEQLEKDSTIKYKLLR